MPENDLRRVMVRLLKLRVLKESFNRINTPMGDMVTVYVGLGT